ncbi:hypothetical protein [Methylotenera versatilis]|uniref:hypothetical protein n=1 Tax=Methylotenera versatilis TaxID=1055487 RepID=UPI0006464E41|nr:hypothetical protein [Methylotenera versatilis]
MPEMTQKNDAFPQSLPLANIVQEVERNGFCSAYCHDIVGDELDFAAQAVMIKVLANNARLQVSFNEARKLCVFEALAA